VIFGNGYNQSSGTTASLFVLYLDKQPGRAWTRGSNYFRIDLPTPSLLNTSPNGLSARASSSAMARSKTVYAGDLNGNLWKFDLTSTTPGSWTAPTTRCLPPALAHPPARPVAPSALPARCSRLPPAVP
jgi:type IV pilus assembly protein PilY1